MLRSIDFLLRVRAVVPLVLVAVELVLDVLVQRPRRRGEVPRLWEHFVPTYDAFNKDFGDEDGFNLLRGQEKTSLRRNELKYVSKITVVDEHTIKLDLSTPFAPFR